MTTPEASPSRGQRVLIVDADASSAAALSLLVTNEGYQAMVTSDGRSALACAQRWAPDVVLTDLVIPEMTGLELCRLLHDLDPDLPVIIVTEHRESETAFEYLRAGAEDCLRKPVSAAAVAWCILRALGRKASRRERNPQHEHTDELWQQLRGVNEHLMISSVREQERAEGEAQQRAELNALLHGLSEGVVVVDAAGRVRLINDAARAIGFGRDTPIREVLQGIELRDVRGRRLRDEERPVDRALRGEDFAGLEVLCVLPDGQQRWLVTTGTSVKSADGTVAQAIVIFRDVTSLRRLEQEREEYMALISHDLRTPLNVVLMTAEALKKALTRDQRSADAEQLLRIERNAWRMASMLDELTEANSLQSGGIALQRGQCELVTLVGNVLSQLDEARAKRVVVEARDTDPCSLFADARRVERCITNLLTNALKYSDEDTLVQVRIARAGDDVELDVVDRGIGIAPEKLERIFERYYRTAAGAERAEGLGLGLYITRLIADAHGGRVEVFSEVGKGSTFRLTLPSRPAPSS